MYKTITYRDHQGVEKTQFTSDVRMHDAGAIVSKLFHAAVEYKKSRQVGWTAEQYEVAQVACDHLYHVSNMLTELVDTLSNITDGGVFVQMYVDALAPKTHADDSNGEEREGE